MSEGNFAHNESDEIPLKIFFVYKAQNKGVFCSNTRLPTYLNYGYYIDLN